MSVQDWNRDAAFHPQADDNERPAITVAGVMVSAYVRNDHTDPRDTTPYVQVSIDYDTADPALVVDDAVPTRVHAGHAVVWESRNDKPHDRADEVGFRRAVPAKIGRQNVVEVAYFRPGDADVYATAVATTANGGVFAVHTVIYNDERGQWLLDSGDYCLLSREEAREVAYQRGLARA